MSRFFDQNNLFFRIMGVVFDLIELNLLTVLCCLPLFTIGASLTAMHSVLWHMVKGKETYIFRQFFDAFRKDFKQATLSWLVFAAITIFIVADFTIVKSMDAGSRHLFTPVIAIVSVFSYIIFHYFYILLSRYEDKTSHHVKNSIKLAVGFFPRTMGMLAIVILCSIVYASFYKYLIPYFFLLGLSLPMYGCAWLYVPIFKRIESLNSA
ncbi:membrane associated protein [Scardovia inopinata]|uniref:DUF624 domain-containing protein n=1 Tax=Scardovia inopinata F0304 TaxID=641146 RepID=W5IGH7_SCAIO|nr:YesL family protein [Scardovia inopinata]EFG26050.1 hypothetical protein HMPREF9020_01122 [Scardovia inopinata F0304]BAR07317.1 hypothetical protein SCIP_1250 [Scardovia inopinata JCM 12537]SUV51394.1 membrane associated protein [Scardovia inopinata]